MFKMRIVSNCEQVLLLLEFNHDDAFSWEGGHI